MFCGVHILVWSLVISATSQQRQPSRAPASGHNGSGDGGTGDGGTGDGGTGDGGTGDGGSGDGGSGDGGSGDSGSGDSGSGDIGSGLGPPFWCSVAGNCSCQFDDFGVTVKCTSVGNNLDEIAQNLPKTTTHL